MEFIIAKKQVRPFTEENFMAIYQVVSIFEKLHSDEIREINKGNWYNENNPLIIEMVDFAQKYFDVLRDRTRDSVGIQLTLCIEACFKDEINWRKSHKSHLKYRHIYKAIHDNQEDMKLFINRLNKRRK